MLSRADRLGWQLAKLRSACLHWQHVRCKQAVAIANQCTLLFVLEQRPEVGGADLPRPGRVHALGAHLPCDVRGRGRCAAFRALRLPWLVLAVAVEVLLAQSGAAVVQNPMIGSTYCVIADQVKIKVGNVIKAGHFDVLKSAYVMDCIAQGALLPKARRCVCVWTVLYIARLVNFFFPLVMCADFAFVVIFYLPPTRQSRAWLPLLTPLATPLPRE